MPRTQHPPGTLRRSPNASWLWVGNAVNRSLPRSHRRGRLHLLGLRLHPGGCEWSRAVVRARLRWVCGWRGLERAPRGTARCGVSPGGYLRAGVCQERPEPPRSAQAPGKARVGGDKCPPLPSLGVTGALLGQGGCPAPSPLTPMRGARALNERKTFPGDFNNRSKNRGKSASRGSLRASRHEDNPHPCCSGYFGRAQKRGTTTAGRQLSKRKAGGGGRWLLQYFLLLFLNNKPTLMCSRGLRGGAPLLPLPGGAAKPFPVP